MWKLVNQSTKIMLFLLVTKLVKIKKRACFKSDKLAFFMIR